MLDNIIGFNIYKDMFNPCNLDSLTSCILLHGAQHIGKFTFAKEVAIQATTVAENVHIINVEQGKSAISIEQIRQLIDDVKLYPFNNDKRRIVIIDEAHNLNNISENALLKLLEEPPSHVLIFLVTNDISKMLPTIRSRCFQLSMSHTESDVEPIYEELALDDKTDEFVRIVYGRKVGLLLSLKDNTTLELVRQEQKLMIGIYTLNDKSKILKMQEMLKPYNLMEFLQMSLIYYLKLYGKTPITDAVNTAINDMSNNLNQKLVLDLLLGSVCSINKK